MSVGADESAEGNSDRHHGWCAARDASSVPLAIGPRGLLWWQGEAAWGVRAPASSAMVARVKVLRVEGWWAGRGQAGSSEGRPETRGLTSSGTSREGAGTSSPPRGSGALREDVERL